MADFTPIIDILDKAGTLGLILLIAFGLHKKAWVPGWVHQGVVDRNKTLEDLLSANAARVEAKLDTYEQAIIGGRGVTREPS